MTIEVFGTYVVRAKDNLSIDGGDGFALHQTHADEPARLVNQGSISVTASDVFNLYGVTDSSGALTERSGVWNKVGGVLTVDNATAEGAATGVFLSYSVSNQLRNDGVMIVAALGQAYGAQFSGPGSLTNAGRLEVSAGQAVGAQSFDPMSVDNRCHIRVSGLWAATGLDLNGGHVANSGGILTEASQATGVHISGVVDAAVGVTNSGVIRAHAGDGGSSTGIELELFIESGNVVAVDNSGLIRADVAIAGGGFSPSDAAIQTILNSGAIVGAINLTGYSDAVINTGRIRGDIDLGDGQDLLDSSGGRVIGSVYGGLGSDTLIGGSGADHLYGEDRDGADSFGADLLEGGGGDDLLSGGAWKDTLDGGHGADTLTGGADTDTFRFSSVDDSTLKRPDLIADLSAREQIDLSAIDANPFIVGDQPFFFVAAFDGHMGEARLSYDAVADVTRLELDVDGDRRADGVILISGDWHDFDGFIR